MPNIRCGISGHLAEIYQVLNYGLFKKRCKFNSDVCTMKLSGTHKIPFIMHQSMTIIIFVLLEMLTQLSNEMCKYFHEHPVEEVGR